MKENILDVIDLYKHYKNFNLKNINFSLTKGSITGFIGRNGAGKSTTIQCIMELVKADSGEIRFKGKARSKGDRISYLASGMEIYPDENLKKISKFFKNVYKKTWNNEKYNYYVSRVFELDENKKFKLMSSGNKMKYLIALELSKEPELIIFDEPTSGLDPIVRDDILQVLKDLSAKEDVTIFFSSHITEDIEKIADHIIYIDDGAIILSGSKEDINNKFMKASAIEINKLTVDQKEAIFCKGILHRDNYIIEKRLISEKIMDLFLPVTLDEVLLTLKGAGNVSFMDKRL